MNPRGVIAVRASPAPRPGRVRTYGNLIEIGLRAVDILQSEVSANDLAGAALINDLIAAREAQLRTLQAEGIGRSEEHTSELQSLMRISYAVFCLQKQTKTK